MMVALRLEPCTMRAGTNIARPDDRTIDEGRASKCEQEWGSVLGEAELSTLRDFTFLICTVSTKIHSHFSKRNMQLLLV